MRWAHQIHLIRRAFELNGQDIKIYREKENKYHESGVPEFIGSSRGLFHEANNFLGAAITEKGKVYAEKKSMFLILYDDKLQKADIIAIGRREFRVTGVDDLGNLHLLLDLSLEEI